MLFKGINYKGNLDKLRIHVDMVGGKENLLLR